MHRTFLVAASIVAFVPVAPALARQVTGTVATGSSGAIALGAAHSLGAATPTPANNQPDIVDYRLNQSLVLDLGEPPPHSSGFSGALTNAGALQGLRFRFHAMKLVDKADMLGGGSGVGPAQYASRKHFVLSISKRF
jgi:hypothetical protein